MKTTVTTAVALALGFGAVAGRSAVDIAQGPPETIPATFRAMEVSELGYDIQTGMIYQNVHSVTDERIKGSWTAKIVRDQVIICSGGGDAPYNARSQAERNYFTPKKWTGDNSEECPEKLKSGDVFQAAWEHKDGKGLIRSVSARKVVP